MYMSPEEFEGYLAKQQAINPSKSVQVVTPKKTTPKIEKILSCMMSAMPVLFILAAIGLWAIDSNRKQSTRTSTWDKILGITASATGYEYDANADTLEKRLTFKKKR